MLKDSLKSSEDEYKNISRASLTIQYLLHDFFESLGMSGCVTKRFKNFKLNMDKVTERYLEISNFASNTMVGGACF